MTHDNTQLNVPNSDNLALMSATDLLGRNIINFGKEGGKAGACTTGGVCAAAGGAATWIAGLIISFGVSAATKTSAKAVSALAPLLQVVRQQYQALSREPYQVPSLGSVMASLLLLHVIQIETMHPNGL